MIVFSFVIDNSIEPLMTGTVANLDEGLFERIGSGDMSAFDLLYRETERAMYTYALSLTRSHDEALDLVQEAYVKVLSAAHLYQPMGKPLAWMFTIQKNLHLSKLRKSGRIVPLDTFDIENNSHFSYVEDPEDRMVLEAALTILNSEEQQIVLLHAVSGMKHKEIAETIGIGLSTTLSKYNRALKKLRRFLEERGLNS
ncbi:RNA polymerase sigma factor [Acidaminobacter sp.]|uniref:RNA polymerase sigma factor n=1 Tax=Acidaminobacter sp. TaxID=1872102 RepID=UPI0025BE1265|nr:RNA polymerase sigma factor [Acidaminobacter sp.]